MTTYFSTSSHNNSDDANFRSWITALHNAIVGCGLVQTSDTGQLDFSTATRPAAVNTMAGYRMYRFDDPLQASAPIFIKLQVGNGGTSVGLTYGWVVEVGTATNGAGTLTPPVTATTAIIVSKAAGTYTGTNSTFACHVPGAAWVAFYQESAAAGCAVFFGVFRTCDDAGAPTAEGCAFYAHTGSADATTRITCLRFAATPAVVGSNTFLPALVPLAIADSHVGVDIQIFPHWTMTPRVRQNPFVFSYMNSELTNGAPISAAPFSGMTRTYLPLFGYSAGALPGGSTSHGNALIWE